jgi:hypothetical protein
MSNVALFNPSQAPAFARNRTGVSALAKALGGGVSGGKRISIKGGVFRLVDGGKEIAAIDERYLDVVIVNAAPDVGRLYYAGTYDKESAASAPDCWSADGKTPSPEAANKQHHKCDGCPQNIAGSGQKNSRACRFQQRIAVVLANDMEGAVLQLPVPATSIFGDEEGDKRPLKAYARWLSAQNIDPSEVKTRMMFDTKSESPKLFFKALEWLNDEQYAIIQKQGKSDAAIKAITMTVAKMDNVAAPLAIPGQRPKTAPAPEPEEEAPAPKAKKAKPAPLPAEDDEEPVVRKEDKKPNAVPKAKSALADMVDDWDETE